MALEIVVPPAGESISNVMVSEWVVSSGQWVAVDQTVAVLETDKINVEVPAPASGVIKEIKVQEGEEAGIGEVLALMQEQEKPAGQEVSPEASAPAKTEQASPPTAPAKEGGHVMPAAQRLLEQNGLSASQVKGTGPGGRVLKEDVEAFLARGADSKATKAQEAVAGDRREEFVKMSPLRRKIAERLLSAQQNQALLTTFNEVDMSAVMALRSQYKGLFEETHGVRLGFMSFFVKSVVEALKAYPAVNAEIREDQIVYKNYYDIGVAVGGGKGLVVPIVRDAHRMSFSQVEAKIRELAKKAQAMKLSMDELQGGTFTISNGGVYGSMLSTPIINPPQSGILGLHNIQQRPVAVDGKVEIRPMMYLALTYDHRIVDGKEAVSFLVKIKECIENPARILLEV